MLGLLSCRATNRAGGKLNSIYPMIGKSESELILPEDYSDRHVKSVTSWNLGFREYEFPEGTVYRIWRAGMFTNCEYFDFATNEVKKVGGDGVHVLAMTLDDDAHNPTWKTATSKKSGNSLSYPDLSKCQIYPSKRLSSLNLGFKMIPNAEWQHGDFAKGLCSPSNTPDSVEVTRLIPASAVLAFTSGPQFIVPDNFLTGNSLLLNVLKSHYFSRFEVKQSGEIECEESPNSKGLIDIETLVNDMILKSTHVVGEHHYIRVMSCYSKDTYLTMYKKHLGDKDHRVGYLEVLD